MDCQRTTFMKRRMALRACVEAPRLRSLNDSNTETYLQGPELAQAATSAAWKFSTLLSAMNRPRAVSISVFHESLATTPCVSEPTTVSVDQSSIADCRYSPNKDLSQSVRAQMEPLTGLNASCPSLEPAIFSQAVAASGSGAPTARTKESERNWKTPSLPGVGAQP